MADYILGIGIFLLIAGVWAFFLLKGLDNISGFKIKSSSLFLTCLFLVIIGVTVLVAGGLLHKYYEPGFCGETCHLMEPYHESYVNPRNNSIMATHLENEVTCVDCHTGPGLIGQIDPFLTAPRQFINYVIGNYDPDNLQGFIPTENCIKGCHDDVDWLIEAPAPRGSNFTVVDGSTVWPTRLIWHPFTENGTDTTELYDRDTCVDCHDMRLNGIGFTRLACPTCHDVSNEEIFLHRDQTCGMEHCHQEPNFIAHQNVMGECLNCHESETSHDTPQCAMDQCHDQPEVLGHRINMDNCDFCHDRAHPEDARVPYILAEEHGEYRMNSTFCSACHVEQYDVFTQQTSKHGSETGCPDCHLEHKQHPACLDCHNDANVPHTIQNPYNDCRSCHVSGGHRPLELTFLTSYNLGNAFCADCHTNQSARLGDAEHSSIGCSDCHSKHEVLSVQFEECQTCHDGILANHDDTTTFCDFCHDTSKIHSEPSPEPTIQPGDEPCSTCHSDQANRLAVGPHSSRDCTNCHGTHAQIQVDFTNCGGGCHTPPGNHDQNLAACNLCHHDLTRIHTP